MGVPCVYPVRTLCVPGTTPLLLLRTVFSFQAPYSASLIQAFPGGCVQTSGHMGPGSGVYLYVELVLFFAAARCAPTVAPSLVFF